MVGILKGGIENWQKNNFETQSIQSISPEMFAENYTKNKLVIDARKVSEYEAEHIENAINIPLNQMNFEYQLNKNKEYYIHCAGGYRSVIMVSLLKKQGFNKLINIDKGMAGIKNTEIPLTKFVCQSKL